jgi:hypothetical protein
MRQGAVFYITLFEVKKSDIGAGLGSGHAKYLTLRTKFLKKDFETVLIDRFCSKTALLRKMTENGSR